MPQPSSRAVRADAEKAARAALAARASLVGELAAAAHEVEQIEGELDKARATHADVYQAAIDGGWTAAELAALGYRSPGSAPAAKRSGRRGSTPRTGAEAATAGAPVGADRQSTPSD